MAEPPSPYIANPLIAAASAGMHQPPPSFGMPTTTLGHSQNPFEVKPNPFGQASQLGQAANPFGSTAASAQPFGQASNPFGGTSASTQPFGQATSQQQASQPGRIQFGQKARTQASTQQQLEKAFQRPSQPTGDPFGRQRPAQAMQAAQPSNVPTAVQPSFGESAQQQQLPGTPAPFAAFGGPMHLQQHPGAGQKQDAVFQTPAAQQPAFSGGIAASPETPTAGFELS